ncbi:MAG: hypothetical protein N2378_04895 [Chloroflexaceae bacterium]|nr:hypothetical protein [Chloroflexaceae bacterium]
MRLLHDPTLHFLLVWPSAPVLAIIGDTLDRPSNPVSTSHAGWLATLALWSVFGARSVIHQWNALPRSPGARWPELSRALTVELSLLVGTGLITLVAALATLVVFGLLAIQMTRALIR